MLVEKVGIEELGLGIDDLEDDYFGISDDEDFKSEDFEPDEPETCPVCEGDLVPMGGLGNVFHLNCRDCDSWVARDIS